MNDIEIELTQRRNKEVFTLIGVGVNGVSLIDDEDSYHFDFSEIKPLLIPLSELTEDQWVQVLIEGGIVMEQDSAWEVSADWDEDGLLTITIPNDFGNEHISFSKEFMAFGGSLWINQLAAFQKLYSLHADLHGLIDSGLAYNKLQYGK